MLQLKYGNYSHELQEASVVITRDVGWNAEGVAEEITETWDISGQVHGDTFSELTQNITALEIAYSTPDKDARLVAGTANTAHKLLIANWDSIRASGPNYPIGDGAEYTTFRTYAIRLTAKKFPLRQQGGDPIIEYSEVIEIQGNGGPDWVFQPVTSGNWPRADLTDRTPVVITQSGEAVGRTDYVYDIPLFSGNEWGKLRRQRRGTPRVRRPTPSEYPSSWQYTFGFMGGVPFVPNPGFPS